MAQFLVHRELGSDQVIGSLENLAEDENEEFFIRLLAAAGVDIIICPRMGVPRKRVDSFSRKNVRFG